MTDRGKLSKSSLKSTNDGMEAESLLESPSGARPGALGGASAMVMWWVLVVRGGCSGEVLAFVAGVFLVWNIQKCVRSLCADNNEVDTLLSVCMKFEQRGLE